MDAAAELEERLRSAIQLFSNGVPDEERRCYWDDGVRQAFMKIFEGLLEDLAAGRPVNTPYNLGMARGLDTLGIERGAWYEEVRAIIGLILKQR